MQVLMTMDGFALLAVWSSAMMAFGFSHKPESSAHQAVQGSSQPAIPFCYNQLYEKFSSAERSLFMASQLTLHYMFPSLLKCLHAISLQKRTDVRALI